MAARFRTLVDVHVAGHFHPAGSVFEATPEQVSHALAKGYVEPVKDDPKGKRSS